MIILEWKTIWKPRFGNRFGNPRFGNPDRWKPQIWKSISSIDVFDYTSNVAGKTWWCKVEVGGGGGGGKNEDENDEDDEF